MRFAIVVARWNAVITDRLLQGALDALNRSGAAKADVQVVRVPGAWEIPSAARTLAESKSCDAVLTLGCLLRGETAALRSYLHRRWRAALASRSRKRGCRTPSASLPVRRWSRRWTARG